MQLDVSTDERKTILEFLEASDKAGLHAISTFDDIWRATSPKQQSLVNKVISVNPTAFGIREQKLPNEPVPKDIIKIGRAEVDLVGEAKLNKLQYLPRPVFLAFNDMRKNFKADHPKRDLLIESGYRSPAFQVVIFIYIFAKVYNFDIAQTLKRVSLPYYSQHGLVNQTAVDIMNLEGSPSDESPQDFRNTIEYLWLKSHAHTYNFNESHPIHDPTGIMWEPWHWQYIPPLS
jgi:LAS superfamily LD-carboxypeptidase LdcB